MNTDEKDRCSCGKWHSRFSPLAIAGMVIGGIALAVLLAFVFGWVVMLLWNRLMPEIFGLPAITYWQGWGLVVLSHILIKGGWNCGGDDSGSKKKKRHDHGNGIFDEIRFEIRKEIKKEFEKEFAKECEAEFARECGSDATEAESGNSEESSDNTDGEKASPKNS